MTLLDPLPPRNTLPRAGAWPPPQVTPVYRPAVDAWRQAAERTGERSRDVLLRAAVARLRSIVNRQGATPQTGEAAFACLSLVYAVTFDGSPTPQVRFDDEDGSVEVAWVAGGESVKAAFFGDGAWVVWSTPTRAHGRLFTQGSADTALPAGLLFDVQHRLLRMSRRMSVLTGA